MTDAARLDIQDVNENQGNEQQQRKPSVGESQKPQGPTATAEEAAKDIPQPSVEVSRSAPKLLEHVSHALQSPNQERRMSVQSFSKEGKMSMEPAVDGEGRPASTNATRSIANPEQTQETVQNVQNPANDANQFEGMQGAQNGMMNGVDYSQMMQMMPNGMQANMMGTFPPFMGMIVNRPIHCILAKPSLAGMPPMGIDPMSAMYAGFGGQGMGMGMNGMNGMNGMSMGMGYNAGQAAFGGFNGQNDAWSAGQNNYYPNAYANANGMGGDFGAQSGFSGYNVPSHQGNYNQMNNHQQFSHNDYQSGYQGQGYQGRGRGRGRRGGYEYHSRGDYSGRGRGNYNHMQGHGYQSSHHNQGNYDAFHHQVPPQSHPNSSSEPVHSDRLNQMGRDAVSKDAYQNLPPESAESARAAEERMMNELNPGDADDDDRPPPRVREPLPTAADIAATQGIVQASTPPENEDSKLTEDTQVNAESKEDEKEVEPAMEDAKPAPIETYISTENDLDERLPAQPVRDEPVPESVAMPPPSAPLGPAGHYTQETYPEPAGRGRGYSRGYRGSPEVARPYRGRGGSYLPNGTGSHISQSLTSLTLTNGVSNHVPPAVEPKGVGVEGAPTGPKALREATSATANKGGRGFSIVGRAAAARTKSISTARSRT